MGRQCIWAELKHELDWRRTFWDVVEQPGPGLTTRLFQCLTEGLDLSFLRGAHDWCGPDLQKLGSVILLLLLLLFSVVVFFFLKLALI